MCIRDRSTAGCTKPRVETRGRWECTTKVTQRHSYARKVAPEGRDRRIPITRPSKSLRSRGTAEGRRKVEDSRG
eukprot:3676709-Pyramimonas_sp.AAC.1